MAASNDDKRNHIVVISRPSREFRNAAQGHIVMMQSVKFAAYVENALNNFKNCNNKQFITNVRHDIYRLKKSGRKITLAEKVVITALEIYDAENAEM